MRQGSDESRDSILDFIKGVTVQTPHITFRRHGCAIMYTNIIEDKLQVFSTPSEGFVKKKKKSPTSTSCRHHIITLDGSYAGDPIQSPSLISPPPCLRQAIRRDKSPHVKPLWSVRCCQNILLPPNGPGNHRRQLLCRVIAKHQFLGFFFSEALEMCTVE